MTETRAVVVRPIDSADLAWVEELFSRHFGGPEIASHDEWFDTRRLPGLIALRGGKRVGALSHTTLSAGRACEVIGLASAVQRIGAATALLDRCLAAARAVGCVRLFLTTSNDNLAALRFYQKRGWRVVCVHRDAITRARRRKPAIPLYGHDGILIADEIELEHPL